MGCKVSSDQKSPRPGENKQAQKVHAVGPAPQDEEQQPENLELGYILLKEQSSRTSNAMIELLKDDVYFQHLATSEGDAIVKRDAEDEEKLWRGINLSIDRGVLQRLSPRKMESVIDVHGKSVVEVADLMISKLPADPKGCLIIIQGMSGTGKGTTTAMLKKKLPDTATWSNGNVFRSLTYLVAAFCEKRGWDVQEKLEEVLAPENVAVLMKHLSFQKTDNGYDIFISAPDLNIDARVSQIQNTTLKEPMVAKNVPLVAEYTQGDVVKFATKAVATMVDDGKNVVLEGRAATVQYFYTPYRFELVINDVALLGQRRAAQRVMAGVLDAFGEDRADAESIRLKAVELTRVYVDQANEEAKATRSPQAQAQQPSAMGAAP